MTPALILRQIPREGRPCHERKRARVDQDATVRSVRDATGFHASGSLARALDYGLSNGVAVVSYGLSIQVSGRDWIGGRNPELVELTHPGNWRAI